METQKPIIPLATKIMWGFLLILFPLMGAFIGFVIPEIAAQVSIIKPLYEKALPYFLGLGFGAFFYFLSTMIIIVGMPAAIHYLKKGVQLHFHGRTGMRGIFFDATGNMEDYIGPTVREIKFKRDGESVSLRLRLMNSVNNLEGMPVYVGGDGSFFNVNPQNVIWKRMIETYYDMNIFKKEFFDALKASTRPEAKRLFETDVDEEGNKYFKNAEELGRLLSFNYNELFPSTLENESEQALVEFSYWTALTKNLIGALAKYFDKPVFKYSLIVAGIAVLALLVLQFDLVGKAGTSIEVGQAGVNACNTGVAEMKKICLTALENSTIKGNAALVPSTGTGGT